MSRFSRYCSALSMAAILVVGLGWQAPPAAPAPPKPAAPAQPSPTARQDPTKPGVKLAANGEPASGFVARHEQFVKRAKEGKIDLLFLGDSITQGWNNNQTWQSHYAPLNAANFGIGGDRTQHVLWRITNGELEGIAPKAVVLMIGTNNLGDNSVEQIAEGITNIVKTIRTSLPKSKVLLLAIFPRGEQPSNPVRAKLAQVNQIISKLDDGEAVRYLDIGGKFLSPDGTLSREIMPDFLHLTPKGYEIWAEAMQPTLDEMLK